MRTLPLLLLFAAAVLLLPRDVPRATAADAGNAAVPPTSGAPDEPAAAAPGGEALIRELGCAGCHAGLPAGDLPARTPALDDSGPRRHPAALFAYLRSPAPSAPGAARMPDYRLDAPEALALALYLGEQGSGDRPRAPAPDAETALRAARQLHPEADARLGRRIFISQNCAACHARAPARPWPAGPYLGDEGARAEAGWLRGWLRHPTPVRPFGHHPGTGTRMPDFRLSPGEADSIAAYLLRAPGAAKQVVPPAPLSPFSARKAELLLRDKLSCLGCHRLDGEGGRIGPDLSDVAARRRPAWIRAMVENPQRTVPGTVMPHIPMPAATRELIVRYLQGRTAAGPAPERISLVEHPLHFARGGPPGSMLYGRYCASCHGPQGAGDGYNARYLPVRPTAHANGEYLAARPDDTMYDGIHAGGAVLGRSHRMPPFGQTLAPPQIRALVAHIRDLCNCQGPAWSRDGRGGSP